MPHRGFSVARGNQAVLGIALGPQGGAEEGVEIQSVSPAGGAAQAGLRPGDVLLELNGHRLAREANRSSHEKLLSLMAEVKPGERVKVRYRRDGKVQEAQIETQTMRDHVFAFGPTEMHSMSHPMPHVAFFRAAGVFGNAELVALTPKLGQYFGTDKGLLVVRAPEDSRLKLEEGDVILDIDGRMPSSSSHALRILSSYQSGEKLRMDILRTKKKMSLEVTVPEDLNPPMDHMPPIGGIGTGRIGVPGPHAMPLPPPGAPRVMKLPDDRV
jgi:S1-C subfamily serine protease